MNIDSEWGGNFPLAEKEEQEYKLHRCKAMCNAHVKAEDLVDNKTDKSPEEIDSLLTQNQALKPIAI